MLILKYYLILFSTLMVFVGINKEFKNRKKTITSFISMLVFIVYPIIVSWVAYVFI